MTRAEEITKLHQEGHGQRAISRQIGISQPAVRKYLLKLGLLGAKPPDDNPPHVHSVGQQEPIAGDDNHAVNASMRTTESQQTPAPISHAFLPRVITSRQVSCGWCHGQFSPKQSGQRYCCNACGHRANGLSPLVEHEEGCPVLADNQKEEFTKPY